MVIHSGTSDRRVQYSRVGLEVKIYDTPASFSSFSTITFVYIRMWVELLYLLIEEFRFQIRR